MSYKIIGKYIKELNFNIPKPKLFFYFQKILLIIKLILILKVSSKTKYYRSLTTLALNPIKKILKKLILKLVYSTILN